MVALLTMRGEMLLLFALQLVPSFHCFQIGPSLSRNHDLRTHFEPRIRPTFTTIPGPSQTTRVQFQPSDVAVAATSSLPFIRHEMSVVAKAAFTILCGFAAAKVKRILLERLIEKKMKRPPGTVVNLGRLSFFNTFFNVLIIKVVSMFLIALFKLEFGHGLTSIFAAGSFGAIVLGLASKDLAQQVVGGFVIATWDVYEEGDTIELLDSKIKGKVRSINFMDTEIQRSDNVIVKIPNSRVFNQHVSNLSRVKQAQVKQTLRLKYSDLRKMPVIIQEIKNAIESSCHPYLVADGSRPFEVYLDEYMEDHVKVVVNCHLHVQPGSSAYNEGKQTVLHAIGSAIEKCKIEFAIPAIHYYGVQPGAGVFAGGLGV